MSTEPIVKLADLFCQLNSKGPASAQPFQQGAKFGRAANYPKPQNRKPVRHRPGK